MAEQIMTAARGGL